MGGNGWQPAKATIDAKRESGKVALTLGASGVTGLGRKRYEYVVEVSPSDGRLSQIVLNASELEDASLAPVHRYRSTRACARRARMTLSLPWRRRTR